MDKWTYLTHKGNCWMVLEGAMPMVQAPKSTLTPLAITHHHPQQFPPVEWFGAELFSVDALLLLGVQGQIFEIIQKDRMIENYKKIQAIIFSIF